MKLKIPMERIPRFLVDLKDLADRHGSTVCQPIFGHIDALAADYDELLIEYGKGAKIKFRKKPPKV